MFVAASRSCLGWIVGICLGAGQRVHELCRLELAVGELRIVPCPRGEGAARVNYQVSEEQQ